MWLLGGSCRIDLSARHFGMHQKGGLQLTSRWGLPWSHHLWCARTLSTPPGPVASLVASNQVPPMADTDVCWNMGKGAATTGQESCFAEAAARNQGPEGDVDILRRQLGECMCCLPGSPSPATTSSWKPWPNAVFIHRHVSVAMRALVPCRAATVAACCLMEP